MSLTEKLDLLYSLVIIKVGFSLIFCCARSALQHHHDSHRCLAVVVEGRVKQTFLDGMHSNIYTCG